MERAADLNDTPTPIHIRIGAPDRRRTFRSPITGFPSRAPLVELILSHYREMPGLSLRINEAARLFGLHEQVCRVVLDDLVRARRLRQAADGAYLV